MHGHSINQPTVLHVDTERGWRGGQRQALWLARALASRGVRSIVVARAGEPLATRAAAAGLPVVAVRPWSEADPWAALTLRRVIGREGATIVHAHSGHAVALGAMAALGTPARLVVTRRVDFPLRDNLGTRWKYNRAAAVIAISSAVAAVLRASGVASARITVIPSGIDLSRRVEPATPAALASLGVPPGSPLVIQVAQLVGHKDPLAFVRAIDAVRRLVPGVRAVMIGDGHLRADVEQAIAAAGLGDVLRVAGYRDDADALIAAADVVTLSSREEGMGTVLLDAMAFGGTVAATAAGGIPEIVTDGVTGLLAPVGDGAALGRQIARLLADRPLALRLRAAARDRVHDFSVERTAELTAAVYERVSSRAV